MANNIAIYPGTFDPLTNGHVDLVHRASNIFDTVIIAIAKSSKKSPLFKLEERVKLAETIFKNNPKVIVKGFDNLLIHFAKENNANVILRGLRAVSDFDFEFQLAGMNRSLDSEIETIFLTPGNDYTYISSSLIREIASLNGNVTELVPPEVLAALNEKFNRE